MLRYGARTKLTGHLSDTFSYFFNNKQAIATLAPLSSAMPKLLQNAVTDDVSTKYRTWLPSMVVPPASGLDTQVQKLSEMTPWSAYPSSTANVFQSFSCVPLESATTRRLDEHVMQHLSGWDATEQAGDALYLVDLGVVARQMQQWQRLLPRVHPFYAVKCCGDKGLLATLASMGANFDCASPAEIKAVMDLGVTPDRIIYANPCKPARHILHSRQAGVDLATFDTAAELEKCARLYPSCRLLLRLRCDDPAARCPLGDKYGAELHEAEELIRLALKLNLQVVGISFHVGSGASDPRAFSRAISQTRKVWDMGLALGANFTLLDIGGGFSGSLSHAPANAFSTLSHSHLQESIPRPQSDGVDSSSDLGSIRSSTSSDSLTSLGGGGTPALTACPEGVALQNVAAAINSALEEHFPAREGVKVIAEPGRYFAEASATLYASIFSKRIRKPLEKPLVNQGPDLSSDGEGGVAPDSHAYWIGDGLYGSFNSVLYDHATIETRPLRKKVNEGPCDNEELFHSTLFGPTCDGLDTILRNVPLPDMKVGDWLVFPNMGAYTLAAGSNFNGFGTADIPIVYVASEEQGARQSVTAAIETRVSSDAQFC